MKTLEEVKQESTCQKRITVCEIYDEQGVLLSRESNRCNPENGVCHRLGLSQTKEGYDVNSFCNWVHAEIMAINALPANCVPFKAIIYGHTFYCDNCENALKAVGVNKLEIL